MNKQIAFAYGIAGLAVAAAFITYITAPVDGFDSAAPEQTQVSTLEQPQGSTLEQPIAATPQGVVLAQAAPQEELPPEYVYVDEPAPTKRYDDDDDDGRHERDDDREHGERRDHDDDDD